MNYNNIANRLTFLSPLSSNATNKISIDLSAYSTTSIINNQITNTSNYVLNTQNTLQNNINVALGYSSNFTTGTSNILINRILSEDIINSNILINRIVNETKNTSNYISSKFLPLTGGEREGKSPL